MQSEWVLIGMFLSEATILKYVMQLHQALGKWEQDAIEKIPAMPAMPVDEYQNLQKRYRNILTLGEKGMPPHPPQTERQAGQDRQAGCS